MPESPIDAAVLHTVRSAVANLSHEPKNYVLLTYDAKLIVRGVAFRSSRAEPFGDAFLYQALYAF